MRDFFISPAAFSGRRTHRELATRDHHEGVTVRAVVGSQPA